MTTATTATKVAEMTVAEGVVVPVRSGTSPQAKDGGPPSILRVCSTRIDTCYHTVRVELIGHFKPCMNEIYLHIDARMADYIRTHPYRPF